MTLLLIASQDTNEYHNFTRLAFNNNNDAKQDNDNDNNNNININVAADNNSDHDQTDKNYSFGKIFQDIENKTRKQGNYIFVLKQIASKM